MAILSVVIPAYNAEKYIAKCIESITEQVGFEGGVEIVVVVDGATDETLNVAKAAIQGCAEVAKILYQKKSGASVARNYGLEHVKTEYVTFLDADDFWLPGFLATILPLLKSDIDLVEYDSVLVREDGAQMQVLKIAFAAYGMKQLVKAEDFLKIFRCYAWARIYRTSIVLGRRFPSGRRFEDSAVIPWYYWESKKIISVGSPLVAYRQHPVSVLSTPEPKDVDDITFAICEAVAMFEYTNNDYWNIVSFRIFHFACQRTTFLPFREWPKKARAAQFAVSRLPRQKNPVRRFLSGFALLYVGLLFLKYRIMGFL